MKSLEHTLQESNRLVLMTAGELIGKIRGYASHIDELKEALAEAYDERDRLRRVVDAQDEVIKALKARFARINGVETPNGLTHKTQI